MSFLRGIRCDSTNEKSNLNAAIQTKKIRQRNRRTYVKRAFGGNWTLDLLLTKEVLYHWATKALIEELRLNKKPIVTCLQDKKQSADFLSGRTESNCRHQLGRLRYYHYTTSANNMWAVMDSNHRKLTLADLQSASFSHSDNYPLIT